MNIDKILNDLDDPDSVKEFFDTGSGLKVTVEFIESRGYFSEPVPVGHKQHYIKTFTITVEHSAKDLLILRKDDIDQSDAYEYLDTFLNGFWSYETGSSVFQEVEKD